MLHKKPILVERGSFRPVTHVNVDMLRSAHEKFAQEPEVAKEPAVSLMEITMQNLQDVSGGQDGQIDLRDFLGPGRRAGRLRQDGADLQLFRVLPPGRLSGDIHE